MSKFLDWIGLPIMSNRDAIMEELDALSDVDFYQGLLQAARLTAAQPIEWLRKPCEAERLDLTKESASC